MKMFHKGISEHLGLLETTMKEIKLPIELLDLMGKKDLLKVMEHQIELENYEAAELIKQKIEKIK